MYTCFVVINIITEYMKVIKYFLKDFLLDFSAIFAIHIW